LFWE